MKITGKRKQEIETKLQNCIVRIDAKTNTVVYRLKNGSIVECKIKR